MLSAVVAPDMFPSFSSYLHGPPSLHRVRVPPFPDFLATIRTSDSPAPSDLPPVVPAGCPTAVPELVLGQVAPAQTEAALSGLLAGSPVPALSAESSGSPRFLG